MAVKKINQFVVGESILGYFLVKTVERKVSSTSKKYLDFTLGDKTGEIASVDFTANSAVITDVGGTTVTPTAAFTLTNVLIG